VSTLIVDVIGIIKTCRSYDLRLKRSKSLIGSHNFHHPIVLNSLVYFKLSKKKAQQKKRQKNDDDDDNSTLSTKDKSNHREIGGVCQRVNLLSFSNERICCSETN